MTEELALVAACGCELGEGPVWRAEAGDLLFTDILGRALLRFRPGRAPGAAFERIPLDSRLSAFAPVAGADDFLAVMERGLFRLTVDFAGATAQGASLDRDAVIPDSALMNDGTCDSAGRFVFGSKALNETDGRGAMMRFDGRRLETLREGFVVFNGPAFSPAGDRVYFADTPSRDILTASYDPASGAMGAPELFARLEPDAGYPDGMAVDAEGRLWNAHWDGWRLTRYRPDGAVDRVVPAPVSRPTSLAFGGPDLQTLYVTSARRGREDAAPATEPMAGDLFALPVETSGAPVPAFRAA